MSQLELEHVVVYKRAGYYSLGPLPQLLPDGRLAVALLSSAYADHFGQGDWIVLVSQDQGRTFAPSDDPTIPFNWPADNPRERYDRFAAVMPDGSYLAAGSVGFEAWPADRSDEAKENGFYVIPHPDGTPGRILVNTPKVFVQRSRDRGRTWRRQAWPVPGFEWITAFPRAVRLASGAILVPVYAHNIGGTRFQSFVWRSGDDGDTWRLLPMATSVSGDGGDETCFFEVAPGRVLALLRHVGKRPPTRGYLLESWSTDEGRSWSSPLRTEIRGYPPHVIRLHDGRLLCAVTYRWEPMGIRAVLSHDDGTTWDTANTIVLRDDAGAISTLWRNRERHTGAADVGYPITVQFPDGTLFTSYWITTPDGVTHVQATRWRL